MKDIRSKFSSVIKIPYVGLSLLAFVVYLVTELINQRGPVGLFYFTVQHLFAFFVNYCIVLFSYSVVLLFRHRHFVAALVTTLWIIVDIVNIILLLHRNTQFNASDILIFRYGVFITIRYINLFQILLLVTAIVVVVLGLIWLYKKCPVHTAPVGYLRHSMICIGLVLLCTLLIIIGRSSGVMKPRFTNIDIGYKENGFVFAFGCSIFEKSVDEPEDYSEDSIQGIAATLNEPLTATDKRPNVIFIQLESFIDPSEIKGIEFDEDPVPNFNRICREGSSGYLGVSVIGGGTANTEFEILSGMSLANFGPIEYPYETFLDKNTCESMAYNYKALGYGAHAIHNFSAGFYMRNEVYANLGFDTYTAFEHMSNIEYNPIGWAKDSILERYILSAMDTTEESDFVFAVSVQGHGSYPDEFDDSQRDMSTVYYNEDIESLSAELEYYQSQLKEMDDFIGHLTDTLSDYPEDCVVVLYGDHLPGLPLTPDMLKTGSLYRTEYAVWANYDIDTCHCDLDTYQLAAHVQELIGFSSGKITQLNQKYRDDPDYKKYQQTVAYDIIEGNMVTYGGKNPFVATDIKFGVEPVVITDISYADNVLYVGGQHFNEHSAVYINGNYKNTVYLSDTSLMVENVRLQAGNEIAVAQMNYQMPWRYLDISEALVYAG